jgi:type II secretory pathway pseudopilin PulG
MANKFDHHMIFRIVLIVLAAFVLFALINYYNSKQSSARARTEKFYQDAVQTQQYQPLDDKGAKKLNPALANDNPLLITGGDKEKVDGVRPSEETSNSDFRAVDFSGNKLPSDCFPRDRLSAEDLLPNDAANSKWAQVNPAGQGDVSNQNFLTSGWAIGINTVSGTLRNANLQLRSEPPNPRGAWPIMNSTIEPDLMRKSLEVGGDCGQ